MTSGRKLTDLQALDWRDTWSYSDRKFIEHALSVLPEHELIEVRPGRLVAKVDGKEAFVVRPGFVSWTKGTWAGDIDGSLIPGGLLVGDEGDGTLWAKLSTLRDADRSSRGRAIDHGMCPVCHMQLPATGVCDNH